MEKVINMIKFLNYLFNREPKIPCLTRPKIWFKRGYSVYEGELYIGKTGKQMTKHPFNDAKHPFNGDVWVELQEGEWWPR